MGPQKKEKSATQRCSTLMSLKDRGPFSPKIIIKTHGNTDVADLTFDMPDCCVLDSFPCDLFPLQVNLYTLKQNAELFLASF